MKKREEYKNYIKKNTGGGKYSDGKNVPDVPDLIIEMFDRQSKLNNNFRSWDLEKGIRWIMGYANFINQNEPGRKISKFIKKDYPKGTIIMVDFFGSFGNELTYDHPAIVLAESGNDLIIAPISSTPSLYSDSHYYHVDLPKGNSEFGSLTKDSVIKIEQLRYISKKRILYKKKRVINNDKLKQIDNALMQLLAEKTFNKFQVDLAKLQSDLSTEISKNQQLEEEVQELKEKVRLYEEQFEEQLEQK
ncbi:type II toxin-antitoxin system PemK/MazF family toxin [Lysinibacillus fusiformis]|uniref:type II toxin-antitoxin system PemK/MazF family toxin n=1 Tax=Lysinibacillus fusiformis TaxID=28031 RepID=UPI003AAEA192